LFCHASLGTNAEIELFPVGRRLAFDADKGRLWAVCPKCARWNLTPLEERWEAIEACERLFRDTRARVQTDNIGLAKLRDGSRLVRVGGALPGELAVWRYGESLVRRRRRYLAMSGGAFMLALSGPLIGLAGTGISVILGYGVAELVPRVRDSYRMRRVVQPLRAADTPDGRPVTVYRRHLETAHLVASSDGGIGIHLSTARDRPFWSPVSPLTLEGGPARTLLGRAMVHLNERGARRRGLQLAVERLSAAGSPDAYLRDAAEQKRLLLPGHRVHERAEGLALEMALHEETERRALQGELAMLEAMWREAEEIAAIADRLPDLPAPEPPRIDVGV
ncbi:MAG TPA: hypothetical protein VGX50_07700, partial [Longimicrobium sp.]|nr:hypothetical protein [Longimicrobium sp.]